MFSKDYKKVEGNPNASKDITFFKQLPEKRKNRAWWTSFILCFVIAACIFAYGFVINTTVVYYADHNINTELIRNENVTCYRREEKKTYYILFNLGLGLVAMIFGNFVGRLCLVTEECRNWSRRYDSRKKMLKACFSGISWNAVLAFQCLIITSIVIPLTATPSYELKYIMYVLSGIGVCPLIIPLLNLNTKSDVDISTIIEEKETSVGTTLAWSYYVHYLKNVLPKFSERFPNSSTPMQDQSSGSTQVSKKLTSKLILIVPNDCHTVDDLSIWDNKIEKSRVFPIDKFDFQVYCLTIGANKYEFVAEYAKDPLETIATMTAGKSKAIKDSDEREYQVKMFYKTLSEILEDPDNTECRENYILLPIKVESLDSLRTEELSNLIIRTIEENEEQEQGRSVSDTLPNSNQIHGLHTPIAKL